MYFVGHSLGGGIAQIVAANLHENHEDLNLGSNVQSYGVCSPGTLMSSAKFGFSVEALDITSSSLLPRRDVVSMIDDHGGSIQYSECNADSFQTCHYLENVLCELFRGCPMSLGRDITHDVMVDFCDTSERDDDDDSPKIGKSIKKIQDAKYNSSVSYVEGWSEREILAQCDDFVYEYCNSTNARLEASCADSELNEDIDWSWDLCSQDPVYDD